MAQRLKYTILKLTSEDPEFPGAELMAHSSQTKGWQSSRFCDFPQEIGIGFDQLVHLRQVQFLSHQSKIATKIELYTAIPEEGAGGSYETSRFKRLGYLSLDSNERSNFQARELKSVYVDITTQFIKVLFHKCHINKYNLVNQVALIALNCLGEVAGADFSHALPDSAQRSPSAPSMGLPPAEMSNQIVDEMKFDSFTLDRIKSVTAAKNRAIELEDYDEAKKCKDMLHKLRTMGQALKELEQKKQRAVINEEYDVAKSLKIEIDRMHASISEGASDGRPAGGNRQQQSQGAGGGMRQGDGRGFQAQQDFGGDYGNPPDNRGQGFGGMNQGHGGGMNQGQGYGGGMHQEQQQEYGGGMNQGQGFGGGGMNQGQGFGGGMNQGQKYGGGMNQGQAFGGGMDNGFRGNGMEHGSQRGGGGVGPGGGMGVVDNFPQRNQPSPLGFDDQPLPTTKKAADSYDGQPPGKENDQRSPKGGFPGAKKAPPMDEFPPGEEEPSREYTAENSPLKGVPNVENLPDPEPFSISFAKEAEPLCNCFGEYIVRCLYSKSWNLREAAFAKIDLDLNNTGEAVNAEKLRCLVVILKRAATDRIAQVFLTSVQLLHTTLQGMRSQRKSDVQPLFDSFIPLLVERGGDTNGRCSNAATDSLLDIAKSPQLGAPFTSQYVLRPVKKKNVPPRVYVNRLKVLNSLANEIGVQPANPQGIPLDPLMNLAMEWYSNPSIEVRQASVEVVGCVGRKVGVDKIERFLHDLRPAQREVFEQELERMNNATYASGNTQRRSMGSDNQGGDDERPFTCQFCAEEDPSFTTEGLDIHYWKDCPMLTQCDYCQQVIEIASLREHYHTECEGRSGVPTDLNSGACPLCHTLLDHENDDIWRHHLVRQCPNNPRKK